MGYGKCSIAIIMDGVITDYLKDNILLTKLQTGMSFFTQFFLQKYLIPYMEKR